MPNQDIVELINTKLNIESVSPEVQKSFWTRMLTYLDHGKREGIINGRTFEYLDKNISKLKLFLDSVGYNTEEIIQIITTMPPLINLADIIYYKYLLLGCIENQPGVNIRKEKLLERPHDFMIGLDKLIARYLLISETGYNVFTWNNLTHISTSKFARIFVTREKVSKYKIFDNLEEAKDYLETKDVSNFSFDEIKKWDVNKELVEKYESKSFGV